MAENLDDIEDLYLFSKENIPLAVMVRRAHPPTVVQSSYLSNAGHDERAPAIHPVYSYIIVHATPPRLSDIY
jgi:hypothetical protein